MAEVERGAGADGMRRHNLALVLRLVLAGPPLSRVALAGRTGLTKATVSSLVGELLAAELVQDIGPAGGSTGGRPASLLVPGALGPLAVGLRLDTDGVSGCLLDLGGTVRARERRPVALAGLPPREAVRAARPLLGRLLAAAVDMGRLVAGIGAAVPGVLRAEAEFPDDPVVAWAPRLGWRDADPATLLAGTVTALGAAGLPVRIGNDVALAAAAELRDRPGTVIYLGGESELGAAVLVDGAPLAGRLGGSGFGHTPLRARGPRCGCGARGCLDGYTTLLPRTDRTALEAAGAALAEALVPLVSALDPAEIVLGGRLARPGDALLDPVRRGLAAFLPGIAVPPLVRPAALGPDAAARGAAMAVLEPIIADPQAWPDRD
jgi:predicted NBD/HSP70 family sugar kinase